MPALPGRHPGDVRRVAGGPGDQRVVGVSDDMAIGCGGQRIPPAPGQQPDLGGPVHLIAAEVQQHDHPGPGGPQDGGDVLLVALQHRDSRIGGLAQRGGHTGLHVRSERVRGDVLAERRERGGDQARRGGLAVRAGDQDNLPVLCEHGQQPGLEPEPDDTADHRAVPAAGQPGNFARGTADAGGQPGSQRKLVHLGRCYRHASGPSAASPGTHSSPRNTTNRRGQDRTVSSHPGPAPTPPDTSIRAAAWRRP